MTAAIIIVVSCLLAMVFRSRFISNKRLPFSCELMLEVLIAIAFNALLTAAYKGIFQ